MTPTMISTCEAFIIDKVRDAYPNVPLVMSGQAVPSKTSVYIRLYVLASDEVLPMSLGIEANSRNVGLIQADVYGPKDRGAGETGDIAFFLAKQFRRKTLFAGEEGTIVFRDAAVKDMGDDEEEHRQSMRVPYRYDFKM